MKKPETHMVDDTSIEVVINEYNINPNVTIEELAYSYRYSGQVDCEYIQLMTDYKLIAILYNIAVGIFPTYRYSTIPYQQYSNTFNKYSIKCLDNIKVGDVPGIKKLLCRK